MQDEYKKLKQKIDNCAQRNATFYQPTQHKHKDDFRKIMAYAVDFFSCALAGTIIGYILDEVFSTGCVFIISLFLLGIIAGVYNVLKKYDYL